MNLRQMRELEDFREEVNERERYCATLYQKNVAPLIEKFEDDLMNKISIYFEENGFDVKKSVQSSTITAEYKSLRFDVTRASRLITIKDGNKMKVHVSIWNSSYSGGSMSIPADEFLAEKARIQHRLNGVEKNIECYSNPKVYYESNGRRYSNPDELINDIF